MTNRLPYIDNLRVFCIAIVVLIHTAVTYSCIGDWYYTEPQPLNVVEKLFFFLFQSHAQGFSMSLFFFIAGYFIPASLERKGVKTFILDRLKRLGIPVLFYIFLIHPLCVKLVHPQLNVNEYTLNGFHHLDFLGRTGPLWFAFALLIFSILYALMHKYLPSNKTNISVSYKKVAALIGLITLFAFGIRIIAPIGTSFYNLQFCFFAAYIVMFYLGTRASKNNILQNITFQQGKKWLYISFGIGLPIWFITLYVGKVFEGKLLIVGGMNAPSILYAFWESLFCVTFIIALMGIAKAKFNIQNRTMKFLSENIFGVYVFHAPILIYLSVLTNSIHLHALPKFFIIGFLAMISSLLVSWLIRQIPIVGKIFN
ncbi:MAG: acyltransferase [Bacteroidia bacterium]|nr:acyltransferase [Bacteroidia bacterium]